jgi:lipid II:glycine glycyltransferase (peptidoglycan interpeptide bridge formation enzyme)
MAPYALQWQAMRDAKASGCLFYDLYGIPPDENPDHPMAGLYLFKTGFGGTVVHRPGCWDYACRPVVTALYRAAEAARKKLRDAKKRLKRSPK